MLARLRVAAMEPGDEHRDDAFRQQTSLWNDFLPQWSPVTNTGMTTLLPGAGSADVTPQWSPVTNTGMTPLSQPASSGDKPPQWSPVTNTGMTA